MMESYNLFPFEDDEYRLFNRTLFCFAQFFSTEFYFIEDLFEKISYNSNSNILNEYLKLMLEYIKWLSIIFDDLYTIQLLTKFKPLEAHSEKFNLFQSIIHQSFSFIFRKPKVNESFYRLRDIMRHVDAMKEYYERCVWDASYLNLLLFLNFSIDRHK